MYEEMVQDFEAPNTYSFDPTGREEDIEKMKKVGYVELPQFAGKEDDFHYNCHNCEYFLEKSDSPTGYFCKKFSFPDRPEGCCGGWELHPDLRQDLNPEEQEEKETEPEEITKDESVRESVNRSMNYWKLRKSVV